MNIKLRNDVKFSAFSGTDSVQALTRGHRWELWKSSMCSSASEVREVTLAVMNMWQLPLSLNSIYFLHHYLSRPEWASINKQALITLIINRAVEAAIWLLHTDDHHLIGFLFILSCRCKGQDNMSLSQIMSQCKLPISTDFVVYCYIVVYFTVVLISVY